MGENIAVVQTRHSDLADHHLQESRECGEDTELVCVKSESCSRREVATLHDTRGYKHFRMFLVDDFQASGSLEVSYTSKSASRYIHKDEYH